MPRVTVITPAFNAADFLPAALESVLAQSVEDWEIIVVDDGSTDGTRKLIADLQPRYSGRLRYVYQENRGLPAARNAAIARSNGEYLALLDADDVWLPTRLEKGVDELDRRPDVGLVHARVRRIDRYGTVIGDPALPPTEYLSGCIARHIYHRRAHVLCPTALFRRACVEMVGGFDEEMKATEDRDLWFRIARHYRVAYIPEVLAYYRISPNSMSRDFERMLSAQLHFIRKHRLSGAASAMDGRASLGNILRERGDYLFNAGELGQAIGFYGRAILQYPFNASNCYMFFRALAQPAYARFSPPRSSGSPS